MYDKEPIQEENKRQMRELDVDEVSRVFAAIDRTKYHYHFVRAGFAGGLSCGLRSKELRTLKTASLIEEQENRPSMRPIPRVHKYPYAAGQPLSNSWVCE